jgi:hypothetical protein
VRVCVCVCVCVYVLQLVKECMPVFVGVCLSMSAWVAICGEASPGRRADAACVCLSAPAWAAVYGRAPRGQRGGVRPAGARALSLLAGGAPRAEPRARRSGAEPARGPEPQAEPRRGPPPTPPPARARAARRARSPSRAAEPRRRRRPWDAGIAPPGPLSLRSVPEPRAEPSPRRAAAAHPGAGPGYQQVSERPRARRPRPSQSPLRLPPPNFPPRGRERQLLRPSPAPGPPGRSLPHRCPPGVGGRRGADRPDWRGSPGGAFCRRVPPSSSLSSGFPCTLSRAGGGGASARLPRYPWRRLGEGLGLGPGFPRPETPRSERRRGAH